MEDVVVLQFRFVCLHSCVTYVRTYVKSDKAVMFLVLLHESSLASTHIVGFPVSHLLLPCSFLCIKSLVTNVCGGFRLSMCVCTGGGAWHVLLSVCGEIFMCLCACMQVWSCKILRDCATELQDDIKSP